MVRWVVGSIPNGAFLSQDQLILEFFLQIFIRFDFHYLRFGTRYPDDDIFFVFRSAREAEELMKQAVARGETLPEEKRFDSNCITPGEVGLIHYWYGGEVTQWKERRTFFI